MAHQQPQPSCQQQQQQQQFVFPIFYQDSSSTKRTRAKSSDSSMDEETKRQQCLERNRQAGNYLILERKKAQQQALVAKADKLISLNDSLKADLNAMREEAITLRNMLLQHDSCGCDVIRQYMLPSVHAAQNTQ
ncbi:uncharacterized protein BYT42DRAFT_615977 [Radiomyces spectabilis]|uniref:uncharacterized protein n=1 Tax=Radiomyces spectabilis TaxID=64574 RepID=UPI002220CB1B|nr:uncharacterized protein BYT42DRAFT_615977 [Radiomyces spectabilis]KAI8372771.1 hypothetical protein BYT42DRAFT_615977 [Radiomyces spectabilis]